MSRVAGLQTRQLSLLLLYPTSRPSTALSSSFLVHILVHVSMCVKDDSKKPRSVSVPYIILCGDCMPMTESGALLPWKRRREHPVFPEKP